MPSRRTLKKQFKSDNNNKDPPHWNDNKSHSARQQHMAGKMPRELIRHINPHMTELLTTPWFQTAREYFTNPPEINILMIETKEVELLNIISELREYVHNYPSTAAQMISPGLAIDMPKNKDRNIRKIRGILDNINPKRITKQQRRALRKYVEISSTGRELLKDFYEKVVADGKIASDMELIFNPYTSLVNLAEIYAQCTEYSRIRYSVPELGIRDAQIHLYYPQSKRDEYLTPDSKWLPDALRRICFFNRLLGTKKQPRAIHVFLADFRKEFMHVTGKADLVFTPSEINTGVCDMTDIIITRSEESLKTLLHELIHFHSLDFKHAAHDDFCAGLFNITTEQSSFNLFEAHTECLASILHCLTRAIPANKSSNTAEFEIVFKGVFISQIDYTIRKAAQILATSGCDSYSEFVTPSDRDKCQLWENTNVFSYFFVKSFIYIGLQDWLSGCCDQRTARFLDTHRQQRGQQILKRIIQEGYQNSIIQKIIDAEIQKVNNKNTGSVADNSLKMVCVQ